MMMESEIYVIIVQQSITLIKKTQIMTGSGMRVPGTTMNGNGMTRMKTGSLTVKTTARPFPTRSKSIPIGMGLEMNVIPMMTVTEF